MADDTGEIGREAAESSGYANIKTYGDAPAYWLNQLFADQTEARQSWRTINQAIAGKVAESIINMSPSEGGADVAALGQLMKGLYNTPPVGMSGTGG